MNPAEYTKMFELEDHYWWFVGRRQLAIDLLRRAGVTGGASRLLDLGCGTGVVSRDLAGDGKSFGLDMSLLALGYSKKRGLSRLVQADATTLPLVTGAFDGIVALDILEHIEDDRAAFAEAYRVLRPGGVLVLSVPAFRRLWGPHDVALHHFRRYRRQEVRERLTTAGFRVERLGYSVFFLFPIVVVTRLLERSRRGPAAANLPRVPTWANRALAGLQNFEARLIRGIELPWGSSVVAVARKPEA